MMYPDGEPARAIYRSSVWPRIEGCWCYVDDAVGLDRDPFPLGSEEYE